MGTGKALFYILHAATSVIRYLYYPSSFISAGINGYKLPLCGTWMFKKKGPVLCLVQGCEIGTAYDPYILPQKALTKAEPVEGDTPLVATLTVLNQVYFVTTHV